MEGKTFIFVLLSGLCFLPACFPHDYVLVTNPKTWAEAQSYCRRKYTDLASVHNEEELEKLEFAAKNYRVWIGLHKDINSWRWSLEKEGYYGEGEAKFRMWREGEPNSGEGYENCVGMEGNGSWTDGRCKYQKQFVCYNGSEVTEASSSFIFVTETKNWTEAQSYCRKHYTDLASVRNQAENDHIKKIIQEQYAWIGLYRDPLKWSDGSRTSFIKWHTEKNEPNKNIPCVLLYEAQWVDNNCDEELYFVCHTVPMKRRVVKVAVKVSSVKLEDSAEAVRQQFSQTLKDHGLSEDMKLTWRKQPDGKVFNLEKEEEQKKIGCSLK